MRFLIANKSQSVLVLFLKTRSTFFLNLQNDIEKSLENKSKIARDQSVSYVLSRIFDRFSALSRKEAVLSQLMDVHALTVKTFVLKTTRNQLTFLNKLTLAQF